MPVPIIFLWIWPYFSAPSGRKQKNETHESSLLTDGRFIWALLPVYRCSLFHPTSSYQLSASRKDDMNWRTNQRKLNSLHWLTQSLFPIFRVTMTVFSRSTKYLLKVSTLMLRETWRIGEAIGQHQQTRRQKAF